MKARNRPNLAIRYYITSFVLERSTIPAVNKLLRKRLTSLSGLARTLITRELISEGLLPPAALNFKTYYTGPIRTRHVPQT